MNFFRHIFGRQIAPESAEPKTAAPTPLGRIIRPEVQQRWILPQLASITPRSIENILRGAMAGDHISQWELFEMMEDTWPRLLKNLNEIKRAVVSLDWRLEAYAEEEEAPNEQAQERLSVVSQACWNMLPDPTWDEAEFEGTIFNILDAFGKGTSVLEIDWELRATSLGELWCPKDTRWVHPRNYGWTDAGYLGLVAGNLSGTYNNLGGATYQQGGLMPSYGHNAALPFPENKFLIGICKSKTGHPLSGALLRPLAWWWCASNFSADWLLNLAQVFGLPFRWANYDPNSPQATIDAICSMLENMGSAGWAAFPAGTTLELKEPSKGAAGSTPQQDILDRADKQADLLILGQTLTTDVGSSGSRALGDVHSSVRDDVIEATASFAARVFNTQLIPAILRLNFGNADLAPRFCPEPDKEEDETANAQRDSVLLSAGIEMPKGWFYKRHNIPIPMEGEEVIGGKAPAPMPVPGAPPEDPEDPAEDSEEEEDDLTEDPADPEETEDPTEGKAPTARPSPLNEFAKAIATDLEPFRDRLTSILSIKDDAVFGMKLAALLTDVDKLKADLIADPDSARALESAISQGLTDGLTKKPRQTR